RRDEVDEVAYEEAVVAVGPGPSAAGDFGGAEADRGEAAVEAGGVVADERLDQQTPTLDRVAGARRFRVLVARRLRRWDVHDLGVDLEVLESAMGVLELRGQRTHQRRGQGADVLH